MLNLSEAQTKAEQDVIPGAGRVFEKEKKLKNPSLSVEQREAAEQEAPGVCPTVPKSPTHTHKHTTKP